MSRKPLQTAQEKVMYLMSLLGSEKTCSMLEDKIRENNGVKGIVGDCLKVIKGSK